MYSETRRYLSRAGIFVLIMSVLCFLFIDDVTLAFISLLKNHISVSFFTEGLDSIGFRLKISLYVMGLGGLYSVLMLVLTSALKKVSIRVEPNIFILLAGMLLAVPAGSYAAYMSMKAVYSQLPGGTAMAQGISMFLVGKYFQYSLAIIFLIFVVYTLTSLIKNRTYLLVTLATFLAIAVFLFFTINSGVTFESGPSNAIAINDGQIMVMQSGDNYIAVKPLKQTAREKDSTMEFEWFKLRAGDDFFKHVVQSKTSASMLDSDEITLGGITFAWSPRTDGTGFIYPGGIGGFRSAITSCKATEAELAIKTVKEILNCPDSEKR